MPSLHLHRPLRFIRRFCPCAVALLGLVTVAGGGTSRAEAPTTPAPAEPSLKTEAAGGAPSPTVPAPTAPPPADAANSLERVRASYEYGDIDDVVEWSRPVAEGRLAATPAQRALALRYLGIGLFLTGRAPGAEAAFFELLRMRPDSALDPRTTRPDVVTFFERVRLGHAKEIKDSARENNHKVFAWNFLPPVGQFQNGHTARGLLIGGVELASAASAITSFALLTHWERPHHLFANPSEAETAKVVNFVSIAVFGATYFLGMLDGIGHYSDLPDERGPSSGGGRLALTPDGVALTF